MAATLTVGPERRYEVPDPTRRTPAFLGEDRGSYFVKLMETVGIEPTSAIA